MKKKQNKGITLIALIITIIVLLILAGVAISTLTGENGILKQAEKAKVKTAKEEARERIQLETAASFDNTGRYNKDIAKANLKTNLGIEDANIIDNGDGTFIVELDGYEFPVDKDGKVGEGNKIGESDEPQVSITEYVKVGQYVDYEPTKTDVNKTQAVEETKLTYTSPTGTIPTDSTGTITHGNGYTSTEEATEDKPAGGQTFTAKANDGTTTGLKWRVLSVSDDKVELISDTVVQTDAAANFILKGGIGYLYAEQELNEICKIYGYGYGADTSIETPYTVGGPEDTPVTGTIEGSGARSITIEDLNKIAGIYEDTTDGQMKYSDGTVIKSSYGTTTNPTTAVYYPTLNSSNATHPGQSTSTKSGFKYTYYSWNKAKITDTNTQSMLFNGNYWLASRCINTNSSDAGFLVRLVHSGSAGADYLCIGFSSALHQYTVSGYAVRPVVTLKSNVIDINTDYETEGEWKLK